ncbi:hypothetical protein cyc_02127 [Cyclospora cayetanensis]|uniref:Uncharacterized protein n=1 Tax=Cyclospora cayetanensis TaxID=88456 RepID=A0A1D3CWR7_9EIME|nr:hypothetical protein cyc_02127 [Cyclospora cayetanensis]
MSACKGMQQWTASDSELLWLAFLFFLGCCAFVLLRRTGILKLVIGITCFSFRHSLSLAIAALDRLLVGFSFFWENFSWGLTAQEDFHIAGIQDLADSRVAAVTTADGFAVATPALAPIVATSAASVLASAANSAKSLGRERVSNKNSRGESLSTYSEYEDTMAAVADLAVASQTERSVALTAADASEVMKAETNQAAEEAKEFEMQDGQARQPTAQGPSPLEQKGGKRLEADGRNDPNASGGSSPSQPPHYGYQHQEISYETQETVKSKAFAYGRDMVSAAPAAPHQKQQGSRSQQAQQVRKQYPTADARGNMNSASVATRQQ